MLRASHPHTHSGSLSRKREGKDKRTMRMGTSCNISLENDAMVVMS